MFNLDLILLYNSSYLLYMTVTVSCTTSGKTTFQKDYQKQIWLVILVFESFDFLDKNNRIFLFIYHK